VIVSPRSPAPRLYVIVVAGSAAAALLGFAREASVGALFGASRSVDAFYAALAIPFVAAYFLVGGALAPALTAALAARLETHQEDAARSLLRGSLRSMAVWGAAAALLLAGSSRSVARLLVPGFTPADARLTASLLAELAPYGVLTALALIAAAALNAAGAYATPVTAALAANGVALALLFGLRQALGIHAAAWALSAGAFLQLIFSLARLTRLGLLARPARAEAPSLPWRDSALLAASLGLAGLVDLAERGFASGAGVGAIALMTFASKLVHLPMRLFAAPLAAIALPRFVRTRQTSGDADTEGGPSPTGLVLDLLLYAAAVVAGAAGPIVALTLGRGRFDAAAVASLARLLVVLAPAIVAIGFVEIASKYVLALGRPDAIVKAQGAALASYLLAAVLLVQYGVAGLAAARDVAWVVAACGLAVPLLRSQHVRIEPGRLLRRVVAAAAATASSAVVAARVAGGSLLLFTSAATAAGLAFLAFRFVRLRRPTPAADPSPQAV
jgi:putative peptidoglycan lipid II flippase